MHSGNLTRSSFMRSSDPLTRSKVLEFLLNWLAPSFCMFFAVDSFSFLVLTYFLAHSFLLHRSAIVVRSVFLYQPSSWLTHIYCTVARPGSLFKCVQAIYMTHSRLVYSRGSWLTRIICSRPTEWFIQILYSFLFLDSHFSHAHFPLMTRFRRLIIR